MVEKRIPPPPPTGHIVTLQLPQALWFRLHPFDPETDRFAPDEFNRSGLGNARFSPIRDPISGHVIPTLYAASSLKASICEVLLHDVPKPAFGYLHDLERDFASNIVASTVRLPRLRLANLTTTGMDAAGLSPYALVDGEKADYEHTRAWAIWIWQHIPQAQGLLWMSRRYSLDKAVMLFEDRIPAGAIKVVDGCRPIRGIEAEIIEVLDELGAGVIPNL